MSPPRLTPADIRSAAERIGCDPVAVHAVLVVETGGAGGFLTDGRPRILFEAHWFSRYTRGRFDRDYPTLSAPAWDRSLYRGGAAEYTRLEQAAQLDRVAARLSASWGLFQVMGFNHARCGFPTVDEFVAEMFVSEGEHLEAFIAYCEATGCADELAREDWPGFARIYNGPGYQANRYDERLADAAAAARARGGVELGGLAPAPAMAVAASRAFPDVLRIGMTGAAVRELQTMLNARGAGPLVVDGIFGRVTQLAVERYQAARGLVVDGIAGPKTLEALRQ